MIEVFDLKKWEIERYANRVLKEAKAHELYDGNSHTPLDKICEQQLGLQYCYLNLPQAQNGEDVSGYILFDKKAIVLNNLECKHSYYKGRINFTIAHEIGHWILHKGLYDYDKPRFILLQTEFAEESETIEYEADYFSACLLMPKGLVKKKWNELQNHSPQEKRKILADFFRVSLEAMNIRISYLQLI